MASLTQLTISQTATSATPRSMHLCPTTCSGSKCCLVTAAFSVWMAASSTNVSSRALPVKKTNTLVDQIRKVKPKEVPVV